MRLDLTVTKKQREFLHAQQDEVLYGGAAGGGKSHGQLIDALLYALKYPKSRQLLLRRTFPELDRSLIMKSRMLYPNSLAKYNQSRHIWRFQNGSAAEFGYLAGEADVTQYQSAEYDVIRFDELTHFTEFQYVYMLSRCRGVNGFPKMVKSTANPGGVGHAWVKARFIDPRPPGVEGEGDAGQRLLYIPAKLTDNPFLTRDDPGYLKRLRALPEKQRRALLDGDWNIFDGQFFPEWGEGNICRPFELPDWWRRYVALDYGLDMLACYWIAVDERGCAWVYREFCGGKDAEFFNRSGAVLAQNGMIDARRAARIIRERTSEPVEAYFGPPDLWNRQSARGESTAEIFAQEGVPLVRADNARVHGWEAMRGWLAAGTDETGAPARRLNVFDSCRVLIASMPQLQFSDKNPNDAATEPHPVTHAPDAIRYFVAGRPIPALLPEKEDPFAPETGEEDAFAAYGI